jgi:hypothetical protein
MVTVVVLCGSWIVRQWFRCTLVAQHRTLRSRHTHYYSKAGSDGPQVCFGKSVHYSSMLNMAVHPGIVCLPRRRGCKPLNQ